MAFLDAKLSWRVRADVDGGFHDLRTLFGASDLEAGEWLARETCRHSIDVLGMPDLDEMTGGIGTLYGAGPDSQFVGSGRNILGIRGDVDALDAPGEFQVSAPVAVWKVEVVLLVVVGASVAALV